jgi:N-acetylglucosaminyldiphosphoundecaprenol N-acetyl-beta-D-mannosaminyltransferase
MDSAIERIVSMVRRGTGGYVCFSTVHMVMESHDLPDFGEKVNGADMVVPDGMPLVWMQKLQGGRNPGRVRANDLMIKLCGYAEKNGLTVVFYGGMQEVIDGILKRKKIRMSLPKLEKGIRISFLWASDVRSRKTGCLSTKTV